MESNVSKDLLTVEGYADRALARNQEVEIVPHLNLKISDAFVWYECQLIGDHVVDSATVGNSETVSRTR
jgi:hypothetical protein